MSYFLMDSEAGVRYSQAAIGEEVNRAYASGGPGIW